MAVSLEICSISAEQASAVMSNTEVWCAEAGEIGSEQESDGALVGGRQQVAPCDVMLEKEPEQGDVHDVPGMAPDHLEASLHEMSVVSVL